MNTGSLVESSLGVCSDGLYSQEVGYARIVILSAALDQFSDLGHTVWYMPHVFTWQ